jgi:outer membrane protein, multidrug efflux system
MNKNSIILSLLTTLLISGCSSKIGPDYVKPENTGKNSDFVNKDINATNKNNQINSYKWWEEYGDEDLNILIKKMLSENFEIKNLKKNIEYSLLGLESLNSNLFPQINIENKTNISSINNGMIGLNKINRFGLSISNYEIDYLGRIKRAVEVQNANISTSDYNLELLKSNLSYDITMNYFNIILMNERIKLMEEKIKTIEEISSINKKMVDIGYSNDKTLNFNLIENTKIKIDVKILEQYKNDNEKMLKYALGIDENIKYNEQINNLMIDETKIIDRQISERFDIKMAENTLISENANIGLAKAQYFPVLSLSGFLGIQTTDLFNKGAKFWSLSPTILFNIFDMGKTTINVKQSEINKEKALNSYIETVRNSYIEVKSNFLNYKISKEKYTEYEKINKLSNDNYNIYLKEYEIGKISKLELLNNKINLLNNKINFIEIKNDHLIKELNLRKSLQGKIN